MSLVQDILGQIGPCLSSDIVQQLVQRGFNAATARQRVSRANGEVQRIRGVNFPNREKFLYRPDQQRKPEFRYKLREALIKTGTCYGRALIGLDSHGGVMLADHFPIASGLPIQNAKGHLLHSLTVEKLLRLELLRRTASSEGELISLWDVDSSDARRRAAMIVENVALSGLQSWLIKLGWSSKNCLQIRGQDVVPSFGQFAWDFVGPTYLAALKKFNGPKVLNGFIVGDILLDRSITLEDLTPFFNKWSILAWQRRSTLFQPAFVGDSFEPDALDELRGRGCMVVTPDSVFGIDAARDLRDLVNTIQRAAAVVSQDPDAVFRLLSKLSKIEGAALNLRGIVLELILARLFTLSGYMVDVRQVIRSDGRQTDIDVKATQATEVVCCECKAKSPGVLVDAREIQEWLDKSLPVTKAWLNRSESLPASRRFEFWTSTDYMPDARELITQVEASHRRQPITFLNGRAMIEKLHAKGETALVDAFRAHFTLK